MMILLYCRPIIHQLHYLSCISREVDVVESIIKWKAKSYLGSLLHLKIIVSHKASNQEK